MLDTFSNHIQISVNTNISVGVMTIDQYAIFKADLTFNKTTPYTMTSFYNGTNIDFYFNESEGCNEYMYIIYNNTGNLGPFTITPNITASYNPSPQLTGICNKANQTIN